MKPRISHALIAAAFVAVASHSCSARAESFFAIEAGLGLAHTKDVGDGTWVQYGVPHHEHLTTPAFLAGLVWQPWSSARWDFRAHLDYTYLGQQSASCVCVPDANYNARTHTANEPGYIPFHSFGHVQGISLTLEPGYTYRGFRFAVEAGPWLFWDTWHVTRFDPTTPNPPEGNNLSRVAKPQLGWVGGASIGYGDFALRYRYYNEPQDWSHGRPGIVNGSHVLLATYTHRF